MNLPVTNDQLKSLIKESLIEMIRDNEEGMYNLITEAIEEVAMGKAIEEGRKGKYVSEKETIKMLKG